MNNPQLRATPEPFTLTAASMLQVSSSSQTSPHVRSSPACLVDNPRLRENSGKQNGRAAQVASVSGPLCDVKTKLMVIRQKVGRDRAALSPVQLKTGSSSEQNVDALDKKLTDSLWAVACNRDREHKEARQAAQVKSGELLDKAENEIAQLVEDEQCPVRNPRNTSSTQWRWNCPTPSTRREKPVGRR